MKSLLTKVPDFIAGEILLIDKPFEWTSFDVVKRIRYLCENFTGVKKLKVGHGGTLDPLATGLLTICTGKKTKEIQQYIDDKKRYTGNFRLGASSASYDLETEVVEDLELSLISEDTIKEIAQSFVGRQMQTPPMHSAKKIKGTRAYVHARKGETFHILPKQIDIFHFQILDIDFPVVEFDICCSKGTYIRSIIHDFGIKAKTQGLLTGLRRTGSGSFDIAESLTIPEFEDYLKQLSRQI